MDAELHQSLSAPGHAAGRRLGARLALFGVGLLLGACGKTPLSPSVDSTAPEGAERPAEFEVVTPAELPILLDDGDLAALGVAIRRGRSWLAGRPWRTEIAGRVVERDEMLDVFDSVLEWIEAGVSAESLAARMAYHFDFVELVDRDPRPLLVTGYYEPVIAASRQRSATYQYPIRALPADLIQVTLGDFSQRWRGQRTAGKIQGKRLVPYPTRRELRIGGRPKRSEVLAWAKDPVDLFFVEIQGSGTVVFPDGRERRIGYAASNGRDYSSIGRMLIDEGKVERERMSMQAIRQYLAAHPQEVDRVLDTNESVVFFRYLETSPVGSLGIPVTPERSIATDHNIMPRGAMGFLITDLPALADDGTTAVEGALTRLVMNHDTGGAIRGPKRVDFFWGKGELAAERAGVMKQPGRLLFVLPREEVE